MKFDINKIQYNEKETDSIINGQAHRTLQIQKVFYGVVRKYYGNANEWSSLKVFKHCFGNEQSKVRYSDVNHVWVFSAPKAVLHCLVSKRGTAFEYNFKLSNHREVRRLMFAITRVIREKAPKGK